jgi:hypothetical protein
MLDPPQDVDWGSFVTGVAVTVVGGLIVAGVVAGSRWHVKRRERRAKKAEAELIRRTPLRVGGHIVADELRRNADVAKRCEEGHPVPTEAVAIRLGDWRERKNEMAGLRDEVPELWRYLLRLAERLDKAADGD